MTRIALTIYGQPCSKANSREIVMVGPKNAKRPLVRKSDEALAYEKHALVQIPAPARQRLEGPCRVTLHLFYTSERPDLDESIVLDVLQDRWLKGSDDMPRQLVQAGVYRNDRQVREKHVYHGIDARNPRAEIVVEAMQAQQVDFLPSVVVEGKGNKLHGNKIGRRDVPDPFAEDAA